MEKEVSLTPLMIARLFGVPVGDVPEQGETREDSGDGISDEHQVGDPLTELEERAGVKGSTMTPFATIGLAVIGMMMVAVGVLLIFPISLSLEHAYIIGSLGFFVVGVLAIYGAATRARSSRDGTK
jgi:hypothetical protein